MKTMATKPKAAIFDLDGTLANTLNSIAYFANSALEKYGYDAIETDRYRYLVGNGAKKLVEGMLSLQEKPVTKANFQQVYTYYNKSYDDNFMYLTTAYDGMSAMLDSLKKAGVMLGVLSNKPHETTCKIVKALYGDRFDLCFGQRDGIPRKPDPAALLQMLATWGIDPVDCIYLGDTSTDMKTGNNANVYTIGVAWGFRDRQELVDNNADMILEQPSYEKIFNWKCNLSC